jgi:hypothetical protein
MVELVHGLHLSSNVEFISLGVQVLDCGVLLVTAKDKLRLLRPAIID